MLEWKPIMMIKYSVNSQLYKQYYPCKEKKVFLICRQSRNLNSVKIVGIVMTVIPLVK